MPVFDFPTGTIVPHASPIIPTNWVSCDGSAYDGTKSTYSSLWSVIGNTYGGSSQSSFNVPHLGRRVPIGPKASAEVSVTNPSFATNTTGWTATNSVITRDTSTYYSSPASGRWDNNGSSQALNDNDIITCALSGTFTAGVSYTVEWVIRGSGGGNGAQWQRAAFGATDAASVNFFVSENVNYTAFSTVNYIPAGVYLGNGWTRYTLNWVPKTTVSSGVNLVLCEISNFFGGSNYYWLDSVKVTSSQGDGGLGTWLGGTSHVLNSDQTGVKYHRHTITEPNSGAGHNHSFSHSFSSHVHDVRWYWIDSETKNPDSWINSPANPTGSPTFSQTSGSSSVGVTFNSANLQNIAVSDTAASASSAHNNIQPEIALNYIIKL